MDIQVAQLLIDGTIRDRHDEAVRHREAARARRIPTSRPRWLKHWLTRSSDNHVERINDGVGRAGVNPTGTRSAPAEPHPTAEGDSGPLATP